MTEEPLTYEQFEQRVKTRCAQILSDDYKICGLSLTEMVEDMYYDMLDYTMPDPQLWY
jgi:hypothetical protein